MLAYYTAAMLGYLVVFCGAGIGGALRHGVNQFALRLMNIDFPVGTLVINVLGSLAMGLVVTYFSRLADASQTWRLFLTTGILGGFTTFSAFSLDVALLYERGEIVLAALYAVASVVLAIAALFVGMALVRSIG